MPKLEKATLTEIGGDPKKPKDLSKPMEVQFNPTTLKLQLSNQADSGNTQTRPQRQYLGSGARTLTLELVFDTADEGTTGEPRSVLEKTQLVERFALPRAKGKEKQAPPRVRFHWGTIKIEGIIESVSIDIDHFAANGTPLRAKCGLSIKEQDARFALLETGAGANTDEDTSTPTAAASGAPGTSGSGTERVGTALAGESAADFASRMGLNPGAWRGLSAGLGGTLSLEAGVEIGFSASLGAGLGVGLSAGLSAGVTAGVSASFGLGADVNLGLGLSGGGGIGGSAAATTTAGGLPAAAGFQLAAAGGLGPAIESVKGAYAEAGQRAAKAAFADPSIPAAATRASGRTTTGSAAPAAGSAATAAAPGTAPAPARPGMPQQPRPPLSRIGLPPAGSRAAPAPPPPRTDPRAVSFGLGVPLRSSYGQAARDRAQGNLGLPPATDDPQVPRWRALPVTDSAPTAEARRRSALECRCACRPPRRP